MPTAVDIGSNQSPSAARSSCGKLLQRAPQVQQPATNHVLQLLGPLPNQFSRQRRRRLANGGGATAPLEPPSVPALRQPSNVGNRSCQKEEYKTRPNRGSLLQLGRRKQMFLDLFYYIAHMKSSESFPPSRLEVMLSEFIRFE